MDSSALTSRDHELFFGYVGDASSAVVNIANTIDAPHSDGTPSLGDVASGAAAGAALGSAAGPWGAAIGAVVGAIAALLGPITLPWLDATRIGAFAFNTFATGASRGLLPWDIGPGLLNSNGPPFGASGAHNDARVISPEAHNLVTEMLLNRPDLTWVAPDGAMHDEIEAACFMFAQVFLSQANVPFPASVNALVSAQTYDFGSSGDQVHSALRGVMQQMIVHLPKPIQSTFGSVRAQQARLASAINPNVKAPSMSPLLLTGLVALGARLLGWL